MAKARILIEGMIQGVGYRALIKQAARSLRLKGLVRNLEDETVEIFCEGPIEKTKEFLKRINIKGKPEDFMSVNVTEIKCFWEGDVGYQEAWKPYRRFDIDYSIEKMDVFQESTLEDHEYGKLYLSTFRGELRQFHEDSENSFNQMNKKYDKISRDVENLKEVPNEIRELRKTIERFLSRFLVRYEKKGE